MVVTIIQTDCVSCEKMSFVKYTNDVMKYIKNLQF